MTGHFQGRLLSVSGSVSLRCAIVCCCVPSCLNHFIIVVQKKSMQNHARSAVFFASPFTIEQRRRGVAKNVARNISEKDIPKWIWMFPKIGVPQNGWFIMENPINMDDSGLPLFLVTPICFKMKDPQVTQK